MLKVWVVGSSPTMERRSDKAGGEGVFLIYAKAAAIRRLV
jgi:hypothetical protein